MEFDEQTKRDIRRQIRKVVILGGPGLAPEVSKLFHKEAKRSKQYQPAEPIYFKCGKCGHILSEGSANAHLSKCLPNGVGCGKCRKIITEYDFVAHFKGCTKSV